MLGTLFQKGVCCIMKSKKKKIVLIAIIGLLIGVLLASVGVFIYKAYVLPSEHKEKYESIQQAYENGDISFSDKSKNSTDPAADSSETDDVKDSSQTSNSSDSSNRSESENDTKKSSGGTTGSAGPYTYTYEYDDRMVGWISVPGTNINYPVMYYEGNNNFYLTHDYTNRYDVNGSIYIDGSQWVGAKNMTLYGHNNYSLFYKAMFTELSYYENKSYFDNHPTVYFDIGNDSTEYEVVGCLSINIYSDTYDMTRCEFGNGDDFVDFATNLYDNCIVKKAGVSFSGDDEILTLVTCSNSSRQKRDVIICRKL